MAGYSFEAHPLVLLRSSVDNTLSHPIPVEAICVDVPPDPKRYVEGGALGRNCTAAPVGYRVVERWWETSERNGISRTRDMCDERITSTFRRAALPD